MPANNKNRSLRPLSHVPVTLLDTQRHEPSPPPLLSSSLYNPFIYFDRALPRRDIDGSSETFANRLTTPRISDLLKFTQAEV